MSVLSKHGVAAATLLTLGCASIAYGAINAKWSPTSDVVVDFGSGVDYQAKFSYESFGNTMRCCSTEQPICSIDLTYYTETGSTTINVQAAPPSQGNFSQVWATSTVHITGPKQIEVVLHAKCKDFVGIFAQDEPFEQAATYFLSVQRASGMSKQQVNDKK